MTEQEKEHYTKLGEHYNSDRDCNSCINHTEKGCRKWDCEYEKQMSAEEALCYLYNIKTDVLYQITTNERHAIDIAMDAIEKLQEIKKALGEVGEQNVDA